MLWRMAWRNLWRHRGRTLIMVSAVALTYGLMLVGMGINDDGHRRMLEEAAKAAGGQVLVHERDYWDTRASDLVIRDAADALQRVRGAPGVRAVLPRILLTGLLSTSSGTQPVQFLGVDPAAEPALGDPASDLVAGTFLTGSEADPLVLGATLVQELELELGDRVVLTASDVQGEVTRALFHLTGIVSTGSRELDEGVAYTSLAAARNAVAMDGMLTQIGVLGEADADAFRLASDVRAALSGTTESLEVLSWQQAVPEMVGFTELDDAFGYIYLAVIFLVVLFSIANTFLMAVLERVRELGLLSALGLRGRRVAHLLLAESVLMTFLAVAIGFFLGFAGHLAANHWGIPLSAWGLDEIEISGIDMADLVMHSEIRLGKWVVGTGLVILATMASSLYPAWRATRLAPAEAMRFFE
ncbi:MAG: FtsX-like permease family protein [Gemmatimonadota bacterium]